TGSSYSSCVSATTRSDHARNTSGTVPSATPRCCAGDCAMTLLRRRHGDGPRGDRHVRTRRDGGGVEYDLRATAGADAIVLPHDDAVAVHDSHEPDRRARPRCGLALGWAE